MPRRPFVYVRKDCRLLYVILFRDIFDRVFSKISGSLRIANVISEDLQKKRMYVCMVQNTVMRKNTQGEYATITPQGREYILVP